MQNQTNNAKCPHCGAELYLGYNQGTGLCQVCRKQFDNAQAIKLYESLYKPAEEVEEKKKASYGEEYLEVERILTRAEYYFDRKEFDKAKEELTKGLELTNTDYRLYFSLVRAETKNLTDYRNTTHEEYLNKAIACADSEQKKEITRLYKDFYQLSKLSDEDILQYKNEENAAIKKNLESKLKVLIPFYMKKERSLKTTVILSIVFGVLCVACSAIGWWLQTSIVMLLGVIFAGLCYYMGRNHYSTKLANKLFNSLLDIYDAVESFNLDAYQLRETLDLMKKLRVAFEEKNNNNAIENELFNLCTMLCTNGTESARRFVLSHETLKEYANEQQ